STITYSRLGYPWSGTDRIVRSMNLPWLKEGVMTVNFGSTRREALCSRGPCLARPALLLARRAQTTPGAARPRPTAGRWVGARRRRPAARLARRAGLGAAPAGMPRRARPDRACRAGAGGPWRQQDRSDLHR